uniref:Uncharacterized protein n=1 Tax=Leptobrachium leishanense TaxID=445787 RepID=A0A8C5N4V6_9ANUR
MNSSRTPEQPESPEHSMIGTVKLPKMFKGQDYETLLETHLKKCMLFEDETFPANMKSIGPRLEEEFRSCEIKWRRPKLDDCPQLFVEGISLFDIIQSQLGNCWVLSVLGALTFNERLLKNIIPSNQDFNKHYAGIFHFRFWSFGDWWDVVVDDRLPFINGKYLSVQPSTVNEFWPCLLEKAYAKFLGSYQNLHFGVPAEAFLNLTGGIALTFELKSDIQQSELFHMIHNAGQDPQTVMICTTRMKDGSARSRSISYPSLYYHQDVRRSSVPVTMLKIPEKVHLGNGLVERHAYTLVSTEQVHFRSKTVCLIRIWNPWGYGEWTGPWSDICPLWREVSEGERKRLYRLREDGQFWICWEDFLQHFFKLVICSHSPNFLDWDHQPNKWYRRIFRDTWPKGVQKGNNANEDFVFKTPQYLIKVNDCDVVKSGFNVVVSLMQRPSNRHKFNGDWPAIDFQIIEVDPKFFILKEKMSRSHFSKEILSGMDRSVRNKRDLASQFKLAAGTYLILPCIEKTDQEFPFLLQIFLKSKDCAIQLGSPQHVEVYNSGPLPANYLRPDNVTFEQTFRKYATQENKMSVRDLRRFLNEVILKDLNYPKSFSNESSRLMLVSMDPTGAGSLAADNFGKLWHCVTRFKDLFWEFDLDRCGSLDSHEFQKAVDSAGFQVSRNQLDHMILLYENSEQKMHFTDYLVCMVRLKGITDAFKLYTTDGKGVNLSHEKMMQLMI